MSTSIDIPHRKGKQRLVSSPLSTSSSSCSTTTASTATSTSPNDKNKASNTPACYGHERRMSFLSSSLSKSEHTVINIGDDDRPRLITCVKASQGFDWNQDIFLPSYLSDRYHQNDLERRQDPVEDIFISDEEAEGMFPM